MRLAADMRVSPRCATQLLNSSFVVSLSTVVARQAHAPWKHVASWRAATVAFAAAAAAAAHSTQLEKTIPTSS